mgnify:FL=1
MSKIDERFIVDLKGKQFVTYEGLLDLAHQEGLISIEVELLQVPSKENGMIAIAKATAKTKDKVFMDIGDAGPNSVNSMITPHIIRMASTRAKARALRDLTNIGMTAIEELGDSSEIDINNTSNTEPVKEFKSDSGKQAIADNSLATDRQIKAIYAIAKNKSYTEENLENYVKSAYNKDSIKELTRQEASDVIKMLNELNR